MNDFMANARAYNIHYLFGYNSASSWEVAEGKNGSQILWVKGAPMLKRFAKGSRASQMNALTRGGQVTMNNVHMWAQVTRILSIVFAVAFAIIFVIAFLFLIKNKIYLHGTFIWAFAKIKTMLWMGGREMHFTWNGMSIHGPANQVIQNPVILTCLKHFNHAAILASVIGAIGATPISIWVSKTFRKTGEKLSSDKFVRGAKLSTPRALEKMLKKDEQASSLTFDQRHIFKKDFELQHMLFDGTTGTGKSVAFMKVLMYIRAMGHRAIVFDKGCTFVSKLFNPAIDTILNPFDTRCARWDQWCDGINESDFETMAAALIPMHGEGDPFWVQAARTIFSSASYQMRGDTDRSVTKFLDVLLRSSIESLSQYLKGTEASSLVSEKAEKTAISIKSVLATYIKSMRFLEGLERGEDGKEKERFSIKEWIKNEDEKGWLFFSSNAEQHASLRPLISMWLAIASVSILGMEQNPDRRIWVVVDEAPSLHKLPELPETIAEVRKFGGCYAIGIQSPAQMKKVYGANAAAEIFDLLNTRLFFRSPSNDMAVITSRELGEEEIEVCKDNRSVGPKCYS